MAKLTGIFLALLLVGCSPPKADDPAHLADACGGDALKEAAVAECVVHSIDRAGALPTPAEVKQAGRLYCAAADSAARLASAKAIQAEIAVSNELRKKDLTRVVPVFAPSLSEYIRRECREGVERRLD